MHMTPAQQDFHIVAAHTSKQQHEEQGQENSVHATVESDLKGFSQQVQRNLWRACGIGFKESIARLSHDRAKWTAALRTLHAHPALQNIYTFCCCSWAQAGHDMGPEHGDLTTSRWLTNPMQPIRELAEPTGCPVCASTAGSRACCLPQSTQVILPELQEGP